MWISKTLLNLEPFVAHELKSLSIPAKKIKVVEYFPKFGKSLFQILGKLLWGKKNTELSPLYRDFTDL